MLSAVAKCWVKRPGVYRTVAASSATLFRIKAELERRRTELHYSAPVDPLSIIHVKPQSVTDYLPEESRTRYALTEPLSPIVGGGWDTECVPIAGYDLFASFRNHFVHAVPWDDTAFHERVSFAISNGSWQRKWGVTDQASLDRRCRDLDALYDSIRTRGYRRQRRLRTTHRDPIADGTTIEHLYPPALHEVTVHIGRTGEFIFHDGRNRFAIAAALELDTIPVRVRRRHDGWQRVRERVAAGDWSHDLVDPGHPDLRDISSPDARASARDQPAIPAP